MAIKVPKHSKLYCTDPVWTGRADCKRCAIRNQVMFAGLTSVALNEILHPIDQYEFPPGSTIYWEGKEEPSIYTVRDGLVKLLRYLPDGSTRILRLMHHGDVIGMERILRQPYQHTAVAVSRVNVCRIPLDVIRRLFHDHPELHEEVMVRWNEYMQRADDAILYLSTGPIRQRVCSLIRMLAFPQLGDGPRQVELLNREDMASMLGVRVESVSRTIAEMKREGILRRAGTELYDFDKAQLEQFGSHPGDIIT